MYRWRHLIDELRCKKLDLNYQFLDKVLILSDNGILPQQIYNEFGLITISLSDTKAVFLEEQCIHLVSSKQEARVRKRIIAEVFSFET